MNLKIARKVSKNAVFEAGKILMSNIDKVKKISYKRKSDIVTDIDLKCNRKIIEIIKKEFPDHSIISEETGVKNDFKSDYTWIIDPLDGTINYTIGYPPFRVGICLMKKEINILSAIYNPVKNQLYFAERGGGATLNGKKIRVNNNGYLLNSVVMTHLSSRKQYRVKTISMLNSVFEHSLQIRIFGSGLSSLCYIARGNYEAFFNIYTYPWDIFPGELLIREAGGKVTDIKGDKLTLESDSIIASNGKVHDQILEILEKV